MKQLNTLWLLLLLAANVYGQDRTVTGKITSAEDNNALPGVSVIVKGTAQGVVTDANGRYSIGVPAASTTLVFSSIGYVSKEIAVGNQSVINVDLAPDVRQLGEVVVTALGLEQQKRAINYAQQQVKGEEIIRAREPNIVNALNGKVAGVQIISQAGSPGAAASINIRGKSSFQGNSQPLFVVDGIPVNNSFNTNASSSSVDNSNRVVDINPDDIESISVLKGPAATALYGIQAGAGVVIITTKKGSRSDTRQTTVSFNSSFAVDQVNRYFPLQDRFATGNNGTLDIGPGTTNMFGPAISDLRYSSTLTDPRYLQGRIVLATDPTAGPNVPQVFDNQRNFYQNGSTYNNHLSVSSGNKSGNMYFSIGRLSQTGVIPNNTFERTTVKLSGESELNSKLRISSSLTYINSGGNRVGRGDNFTGVTQGLYRTPAHFDIFNGASSATDAAGWQYANGSQRNFRNRDQVDGLVPGAAQGLGPDSPLWTVNKNPYRDRVDRVQGFAQLNYQILPWLSVLFRAGADVFADRRVQAFDIGSFGGDGRFGRIFEETLINKTFNTDFVLTANKQFGKINLSGLVGHNFFDNNATRSYLDGNTFNQPGFFNISNATVIANPQQSLVRRRTFAAFGSVKADYNGWAFLEATLRNEWASTLPADANSFMFPSVSGGVVVTDALKLNSSVLSFAKIRASYAQVGQIPGAYQTETFFVRAGATDGFGSGISFPLRGSNVGGSTIGNQIGNPTLKPETNSTVELGVDLAFLDNRIRLDVTYYNSRNRNQIILAPVASSSGFTSRSINAGELQNRGIEAVLTVAPLKKSAFQWEASFNFTRNRNFVVSTFDGNPILLPGFGTIFQPRLVPGQQFGVFYGSGWLRDTQGRIIIEPEFQLDRSGQVAVNPTTGQPIPNAAAGFPVRADNLPIGNPNPDFLLGIRNTFSYKGLTLSFLWDIRSGGDVWNGTEAVLTNIGATTRTLDRGTDRVFDGLVANGRDPQTGAYAITGEGTLNARSVTLTQGNWFQANGRATGAAGVHEQFVEDASWVRLRDLNLSYRLPDKLFGGKKFVKSAEFSAFGRNLLLFTRYPGIDPETSLYGLSPAQGLDYFGNPNTRSMGVSLNATF